MHFPDFQRVLAAEVVSNFGSMLSRLAIPWVAALLLGVTPFEMGLLLVADVAAGAIGSLWLGAIVDRTGKRAAMRVADVMRCALLAALAALAALGQLKFWMLVGAAAGSGLLTVMFELARSAWIAESVEAAQLPARNAQLSASGSLAETAAFALGGWVYQSLGVVLALAVDALSYLVSALFLRSVRETRAERLEHSDAVHPERAWQALLHEAREGVAAVAHSRVLRAIAGIEILVALGSSLAGTSYMIFVSRDLGFGTGVLGMIFAMGGIGSIAGAALWANSRRCAGPSAGVRWPMCSAPDRRSSCRPRCARSPLCSPGRGWCACDAGVIHR